MRSQAGVAAVEFGLTALIFFSLIFAIFDFGWLMFQKSALDSAIHDGCRYGATQDPRVGNTELENIKTATRQNVIAAMELGDVQCDHCLVVVETLYSRPMTSLKCTVSNDYHPLANIAPDMTLSAVAVVRMEYQR